MSAPLEFFRTEQFAFEIAEHLTDVEISKLINFGIDAINQAYEIQEENLYEEYEVSPKQIQFDIKAINHNLDELHKALGMIQGYEIMELKSGIKLGLFCN
jgi:hypothetical protein